MNKKYLVLLLPFVVASCQGDVRDNLGLTREAPDEFAVERRPSLEVPPQFKLLPPSEGGSDIYISNTRETAKTAIFGETSVDAASSSGFLDRFGVQKADPEIRNALKEERGSEDPGLLDRIRSISDDSNYKTIVDPAAERERIAGNVKEGKSVAEGEVKTKSKGSALSVVDKILGE